MNRHGAAAAGAHVRSAAATTPLGGVAMVAEGRDRGWRLTVNGEALPPSCDLGNVQRGIQNPTACRRALAGSKQARRWSNLRSAAHTPVVWPSPGSRSRSQTISQTAYQIE